MRRCGRLRSGSVAAGTYLAKGDASGLALFAEAHVTDATGKRIPFLVDRDALDELGNAGVLSFESIYPRGV
jgi:hypothetical protein